MSNVNIDLEQEAAKLIFAALDELRAAEAKHAQMASPHEGWAVIVEEVDELWEAVRMQSGPDRDAAMLKEAVQVAAMGLRFIKDICWK